MRWAHIRHKLFRNTKRRCVKRAWSEPPPRRMPANPSQKGKICRYFNGSPGKVGERHCRSHLADDSLIHERWPRSAASPTPIRAMPAMCFGNRLSLRNRTPRMIRLCLGGR
jgi:hypothetical protein